MLRKSLLTLVAVAAYAALALPGEASAAPFTQCPAGINGTSIFDDPWPSCAYLITINPDNSLTVQSDTAMLLSIFNDNFNPEDILIGVQNNSGKTQNSIRIQGKSDAEFFAFDPISTPDFPYTGHGNVFFTNMDIPSDDIADGCPGCVSAAGTVNFTGGLANGASTWFGLEGSSQVEGDPIQLTAGVPEPATLALFGAGLISLGAMRRRRKAKA